MATTGPNSPGTLADDAGVGTEVWSNPSNAASSNNTYATAALADSEASHYLKATNFGFAVPAGATINGVMVEVEAKVSAGGSASFSPVQLVKDGVIEGNDNGVGGPLETDTYHEFGGAADLWGLVLTVDDVNASDFGAAVGFTEPGAGGCTVSVDHIRITITYTPVGGGARATLSLLGCG